MFRSATLRLTMLSVAVTMTISLLFSVLVYSAATGEFSGSVERQYSGLRRLYRLPQPTFTPSLLSNEEDLVAHRLMVRLVELNLLILAASALAGYYWARRTLEPIEEAMEAQGRFAADASHQLRTPLAAMRSEIEVALRQKQITDGEARELFGSSLEELAKLEGLAGSLLQLARLESEVAQGQFRAVEVSKLIDAAKTSLQGVAKVKKVKLQTSKTADKFKVMGEPDSLQQIFQILLDNAIKYAPEGSTVTIGTQKRSSSGAIAIADRGPGIKDDDKPHIFERFWRANSQTGATSGHGLGLAIAQQITKLHKGELMVADRPGGGTVFTVELPLAHKRDGGIVDP